MRVLIWNIQFFGLNKIDDPTQAAAGQEEKRRQREFIVSTVRAADPDVFVVLEPRSEQGTIGELATGQGPLGLLHLCGFLTTQNQPWCLVPPLRVNDSVLDNSTYTETVGVFWRKDKVAFRGPTPAPPNFYPPAWQQASDNTQFRAEVPQSDEDRAAAQQIGGVSYRQPYITDFTELAGNRHIRLVSVHLPPKNHNRSQNQNAITQLSRISKYDVVGKGNPNVVLIAGDMNLNIGTRGDSTENSLVRARLCLGLGEDPGNQYPNATLLVPYPFTPQAGPSRLVSAPYTDASSTLQSVKDARLNNYMGTNLYDYGWAYYRQDNPYPRAHTYPAVVADPVQGGRAVAGAGDPLKVFPSAMRETPLTGVNFGNPSNYQHVRNTSDHAAVLMEV